MMTVRSPDGLSVVFNDASYASRHAYGYTDLYTKQDGSWIAQVPNTWLIEVQRPCRVYDATREPAALGKAAIHAIELRELSLSDCARIKAALKDFNARSWRWK